jgi:pimeloyl-ACP methyl ester carboxylesterase
VAGSGSDIVETRHIVNGVATRVLEVAGDGPAFVLLHGFTDSADSWRPLLRELAARSRRAVAIDLPGSGWAPPLGRPPLAALGEFLVDYLNDFVDTPVVLVGNSLGGRTALRVAQSPQLPICGVVGIAPAGLAYGPRLQRVDRWAGTLNPMVQVLRRLPIPAPLVRCTAQQFYAVRLAERRGGPELAHRYASHLRGMRDIGRLWADYLALAADDKADPLELARVRAPVLLIWGRRDGLAALEGAQLLLDAVPSSKLVVFDDCGHCPHVEVPGEIADLLVEFAASPSAQASRKPPSTRSSAPVM